MNKLTAMTAQVLTHVFKLLHDHLNKNRVIKRFVNILVVIYYYFPEINFFLNLSVNTNR